MKARILLAALALLVAGCAQPSDAPPEPGSAAPAWSFTDVDGDVHTRDAPPGDATVLFFMATWCPTCRSKAPMLAEVHEEYAQRDVRFYSLDVDPTETPEQLRAWAREHAHPWPHGIDSDLSVQRAFGVTSQSSVVVLDTDGEVVRSWGYGAVTGPALREALDAAL